MSKILKNPIDGAPISDVQILGKKYFSEKPFEIDTMVKIEEDEVADALMSLYEFLVYMTPEEAKAYKDEKDRRKFECDRCHQKFVSEQGLEGHVAKHIEDEKLEKELGIEVIVAQKTPINVDIDPQDAITEEARTQGLDYGEGLRKL